MLFLSSLIKPAVCEIDYSKRLGQGAGGCVYKAELKGKKTVAVKVFNFKKASNKRSFDHEERLFKRLKKIGFKQIAKIYSVQKFPRRGQFVMKLYDEDFYDYMSHAIATEYNLRKIFQDICKGVRALHKSGIAHQDLKPENILMKGDKPYITDFGAHSLHTDNKLPVANSFDFHGTWSFAAPEIHNRPRYNPFRADIYSLGVLFHVSLTGYFPYLVDPTNGLNLELAHSTLTQSCCNLLESMLSTCPFSRPTIEEVLTHPWMNM
jgi:serine/threonine protein kinase